MSLDKYECSSRFFKWVITSWWIFENFLEFWWIQKRLGIIMIRYFSYLEWSKSYLEYFWLNNYYPKISDKNRIKFLWQKMTDNLIKLRDSFTGLLRYCLIKENYYVIIDQARSFLAIISLIHMVVTSLKINIEKTVLRKPDSKLGFVI